MKAEGARHPHGTTACYDLDRCRCEACCDVKTTRHQYAALGVDRKLFVELLTEWFPDGLTDDCPARRATQELVAA